MNNFLCPTLMILGLIQAFGICHANEEFTGDTPCTSSKDCKTAGTSCQGSKCIPCGTTSNGHIVTVCKENIAPGVSCIPGANSCAEDKTYLLCDDKNQCNCTDIGSWDGRKCNLVGEKKDRFDPTRDVIIPSVILMTLAATAWLCFRLFCNCGKTFRRRRRRGNDVARALEEAQISGIAPSQSTTWVASYRVFGPVSGMDSRSFQPCLLLPAGPPTYDEALKHKVILSSYHPPQMDDSFL